MTQEQKMYALWMCNLSGIGNVRGSKLIDIFGSPRNVYEATEDELGKVLSEKILSGLKQTKTTWKLQEEYDKMVAKNIHMLTKYDMEYPKRLRDIPDAPFAIFYKGKLPEEKGVSVAIVGARDCSEYGRYVASQLGSVLGRAQIKIISGMARGIDGISQMAALDAGGSSFGVLGCGVDICYPAQNRKIYESLLEKGGLISTYPPATKPTPNNFPPRNRIVSGLADVVVVIEARQKSGTLITVDMALEQGKEVYIVPGRITDRLSDGCNKLIKQGAGVLLSPADFLRELMELSEQKGLELPRKLESGKIPEPNPRNSLQNMRQLIYASLDFSPRSTGQIKEILKENISEKELNLELIKLCMTGLAVQVGTGCFCRREP